MVDDEYRCVTEDTGVADASFVMDKAALQAKFGLDNIDSGKTAVTVRGAAFRDDFLDLLPNAAIVAAPFSNRRALTIRQIGTSNVLVLRVTGTDASVPYDAATLSRRWFGGFDDVSLFASRHRTPL